VQTTDVSASQLPRSAPPTPRPRGSRLSLGHVVTLLSGLLAMLLVFAVLRERDTTVPVALAAGAIRPGTPLTTGMFRYANVKVPASVRAHLLTPRAAAGYRGWVAARAIAPGELVGDGDFRPPGSGGNLRSMSIPVDRSHAVAGALQGGDRVDVVQVSSDGRAFWAARGLQVIAVAAPPSGALSAPSSSYIVTVAVTAQQALAVAAAIRSDKFELVRSTGAADDTAAATPTTAAPTASSTPGGATPITTGGAGASSRGAATATTRPGR
jgi:Flp pilus assembly protein CpaB